MVGGGYSVFSEVMAAQEIVSFGYGSQSREIMEVEDYSAKSECYGAFERRRETSTMEEFNKGMAEMDSKLQMVIAGIKAMLAERQGRGASCERMVLDGSL